MQTTVVQYGVLLVLFSGCVTSFIIPEELPTILSLIYSNIPPIKKGTDSRVGVGFRLGEHADFQVIVELGPQRETEPIGNTESKRRRQATLDAAMSGKLGPWAQSVAKYQMHMQIQKEIEEKAKLEEELKKLESSKDKNGETLGGEEWLTKWSKGMVDPPDQQQPSENLPIHRLFPGMTTKKRSEMESQKNLDTSNMNIKMKQLQELYKPRGAAQKL